MREVKIIFKLIIKASLQAKFCYTLEIHQSMLKQRAEDSRRKLSKKEKGMMMQAFDCSDRTFTALLEFPGRIKDSIWNTTKRIWWGERTKIITDSKKNKILYKKSKSNCGILYGLTVNSLYILIIMWIINVHPIKIRYKCLGKIRRKSMENKYVYN